MTFRSSRAAGGGALIPPLPRDALRADRVPRRGQRVVRVEAPALPPRAGRILPPVEREALRADRPLRKEAIIL